MKILFSSIFHVLVMMFLATALAFAIGFASSLSVQTLFFIMFPISMIFKVYSLNSKIIPLQQNVEYFKKENESKDAVIKKFLLDEGVDE